MNCRRCLRPLTATDALPGSIHAMCAMAASLAPREPRTDAEHCRAMAAVLSEFIASDKLSQGLRRFGANVLTAYQSHVKARRDAETTATISQSEGSA